MKSLKFLAAPLALAVATLAVASPAQAQNHRPGNTYNNHYNDAWRMTPQRNGEIRQDINSLNNAIDRATARRTISQREAQRLRGDARDIQRLYANYARNGLTRGEVQTLQNRVNKVRIALRMERRDWDGRRG